jgi:hypothetical protein
LGLDFGAWRGSYEFGLEVWELEALEKMERREMVWMKNERFALANSLIKDEWKEVIE